MSIPLERTLVVMRIFSRPSLNLGKETSKSCPQFLRATSISPVKNNESFLDSELSREQGNRVTLGGHLLNKPVHGLPRVAEDHCLGATLSTRRYKSVTINVNIVNQTT